MNKIELLRVAEILETKVTDEQFNIEEYKCGSVACAIGWYCILHESDLKLRQSEYHNRIFPILGDSFGVLAIADHFDISPFNAERLFMSRKDYYSRQHVIDAIKRFVETEY